MTEYINIFGKLTNYTNPPSVLRAYIKKNGQCATIGDVVGIYIGNELRCIQKVKIVESNSIIVCNVEMNSNNEEITKIKLWDSKEDIIYSVPDFNLKIQSGISTELLNIDANEEFVSIHPFGDVVTYTNPQVIFRANVKINNNNASNGDILGIYIGNELRSLGNISVVSGFIINSITVCNIEMKSINESITSVKVWNSKNNLVYEVPNFELDIKSGEFPEILDINAVDIIKNNEIEISDLVFLEKNETKKIYKFSITNGNNTNDNNLINISVNNLPECWAEYKLEDNIHKIITNPGINNIGSYNFEVEVTDKDLNITKKVLSFTINESDVEDRYSFCDGKFTDISSLFNNNDLIELGKLKFISGDKLCTSLNFSNYENLDTTKVINLNVDDNLRDKEIELELILKFNPIFLKYKNLNLIKLVEMNELLLFEPNRWAKESNLNSYKIIFQGYFRDLHINNGCIKDDFDSGICEDPHILTFGGNRLDLPYDENIYNMIDGLGLKINIKSQKIGDGSYVKYFYIYYNNEQLILDIDNLEVKDYTTNIELKYYLLKSCDYSGYNFSLEKKMNLLILKSTDGIMELFFNSETRGLLIKSKLNFTQENSKGVMMSTCIEECLLKNIND